jgi:hypothetical protein
MQSATRSCKKVADPLAEWVATYIWKVCMTGMSLHTQYTYVRLASVSLYIAHILRRGGSFYHYPPLLSVYLANSVRSLLLSTLLQPSAVLLAFMRVAAVPGSLVSPVPFRTEPRSGACAIAGVRPSEEAHRLRGPCLWNGAALPPCSSRRGAVAGVRRTCSISRGH